MVVAHIPSGIIAAYLHQQYGETRRRIKKSQLLWINWAVVIGSVFPDFDLAMVVINRNALFEHRGFITHMPLAYLLLGAAGWSLIKMAAPMKKQLFFQLMLAAFFSGAMLHLVLDSYLVGVHWLWPFSNSRIGLFNNPFPSGLRFSQWLEHYLLSGYFIPELLISLTGVWLLLKKSVRFR